jgi:toxin ParE1/3/4
VRVRWLARALNNLDEEAAYIVTRKRRREWWTVSQRAWIDLPPIPHWGGPDAFPGTRELVIAGAPYVVPYRVRGETVEILRIFHGARKWPEKF